MDSPIISEKIRLNIELPQNLKLDVFETEFKKSINKIGIHEPSALINASIVFDMSYTYWHDIGALLWFISLLYKLKIQGNDIKLILPEPDDHNGTRVWDFLIRWRFFDALSECVDDYVNLLLPNQIQYTKRDTRYAAKKVALEVEIDEEGKEKLFHSLGLLEITTLRPVSFKNEKNNEHEAYLERFYKAILIDAFKSNCGWEESMAKDFVESVIREGIENSFIHSKNNFTNISMKTDPQRITLAICDNGIGIPESLRNTFKEVKINPELVTEENDKVLLEHFASEKMIEDSLMIELLVKDRSKAVGRIGTGLFHLKEFVLSHGGDLRIRSGKASVDFLRKKGNDDVDSKANSFESPGSMLRIRIPKKGLANSKK